MPLSLDAMLVQPSNSGSYNGTSGTASLPTGTTAGSTVLLAVVGGAVTISTPTGFTSNGPTVQASNAKVYLFRKSNVGAGETSWSISNATGLVRWTVYEVAGLDPDAPFDVGLPSSTTNTTSGTTASSGTTPRSTTYDGLVVAVHGSYNSTATTPATFSGHTNAMTEMDEGTFDDGISKAVALSVSMKTTQSLATFETTATASTSLAATNAAGAFILVYSAEGATREANIAHFWGFKVGTGAAGLNTGNAGAKYFETVAGSPAITADGLQISSSAAAENVVSADISTAPQTQKAAVARIKFRFDGSLPGADLELANLKPTANPSNLVTLSYRTASQKLGVQIGSGTEQLSDATATADTWISVDLRLLGPTTAYKADWQVDYGTGGPVAQTQATATASVALANWSGQLGWTAAATATVTYAYAAYSIVAGHYPLGDYTMVLLAPDPAGTPTISGTPANFNTFTANGTMAGWSATTARDAVDDWPPTVGASADGFAAVTASATDYVEVPLATYNASGVGSIRAARVVVPMWAASATAATCRVLGWDGTTATTLFAEADPNADNTSTPAWICAMWRPANGWDQAKLDAAAIRFGAADATPDIGPHAVGMEVAVQNATAQPQFGSLVTSTRDPVTAGILKVEATPTLGYDATLHYEVGGSPTDVPAPGGTTTTQVIDAPDAPTVNYVALYPPAEDISDA